MDNPEFIELRNRFLFGLLIAAIIVIAGVTLFTNAFLPKRSSVITMINKNETFLLLIVNSNSCSNCREVEKRLKGINNSYEKYDIYNLKDLNSICSSLDIESSNLKVPSLIYIEDGKKTHSIMGISNLEDIDLFISNIK